MASAAAQVILMNGKIPQNDDIVYSTYDVSNKTLLSLEFGKPLVIYYVKSHS